MRSSRRIFSISFATWVIVAPDTISMVRSSKPLDLGAVVAAAAIKAATFLTASLVSFSLFVGISFTFFQTFFRLTSKI